MKQRGLQILSQLPITRIKPNIIISPTPKIMPSKGGNRDEQQALLSLVQKVEGEEWASNRNGWKINSGIPVCEWDGISCRIDVNGGGSAAVTSINLQNVGLSATLTSEIGWLVDLEELNLKGNLIEGTIPQELANLAKLSSLDLTNNQVSGPIPQWWGSFSLKTLLLAQNNLTGEFFHIGNSPHLQSLKEVRLEQNKLAGTIDGATIMQMQNIETISLSQNDISGLIPGFQFGSLPNLKYLYLDKNELVGPLPPQLAQIGKSSLEELWVQDNSLSGTVPASYIRFDHLHDFFIDGNKLTGAIPLQLCSADLNHDFFTSLPPDAERNYCEYIACPVGSVGKEGVYPCTICPGGDSAKLENPYLGYSDENLQCFAYSQRDILRIFYESTSQSGGWSGGSDWNNSEMPVCQMTGITCDGHENIIKIGLKNRNLSGTIPDAIGFLFFLETLDLSDNSLEGLVPSDLRWTSLTRLDVSGNKLRGVLPPLLCMMQELNGNGENNVYYCDRIACPANTFNAFGHHGYHGEPCQPCYDVHPPEETYIGQKTCTNLQNPSAGIDWKKEIEIMKKSSDNVNVFSKVALTIAIIAMVMLIILLLTRFMCNSQRNPQSKLERKQMLRQNESSNSDESSSSSSSSSDIDDEEEPKTGYPDDVELSSVVSGASRTSKNAMDLIQEHKGIALNRQEKVKKAISSRLPQAQVIRTSFSNINVNARKRLVRRGSRGSLYDGYDDAIEFTIDDDNDDKHSHEHEASSSVENNFGEEETTPKKKQETDHNLLDIPMIT